jgi:hypothetical protein
MHVHQVLLGIQPLPLNTCESIMRGQLGLRCTHVRSSGTEAITRRSSLALCRRVRCIRPTRPILPAATSTAVPSAVPDWCEPERLLSSLYSFTHLPNSHLQAPSDITHFCNIFSRFTASLRVS